MFAKYIVADEYGDLYFGDTVEDCIKTYKENNGNANTEDLKFYKLTNITAKEVYVITEE